MSEQEKAQQATCCEALAKLAEQYPGTICQGLLYDRPNNRIDAAWMLELRKTRPNGLVSTGRSRRLVLAFCPCCGAQLQEIPERRAEED